MGVGGTPYPGEARRLSVTRFNILVERARVLRLSQGPSVSPPVCTSPNSDSGHSAPTSPTRPTIQGRRRLHVLPTMTNQCGPPLDSPASDETGRGAGRSPSTSPVPAKTAETTKKLKPYLVSIDNTYLQRVTQVLERLERREHLERRQTPAVPPRPKPRAVQTPTKTVKQRTVLRYIVRKDEGSAHRAEAQPPAQSTPPREAPDPDGSNTPLSEAATPRGQSPAMVNEEGPLQSYPNDGGSASEADDTSTPPTEIEQYGSPPSTDNTGGTRESGAQPSAPEQTSAKADVSACQREHAGMYQ